MSEFFKVLSILTLLVFSANADEYEYTTPGRYDFITNMPDDYVAFYDEYSNADNYLLVGGGVIASTILLYQYDDD